MPQPVTYSDARWSYTSKGNFGVYVFWSRDWASLKPWTYDGKYTPFISKRTYQREIGVMKSYFVGPLLVVVYKVKKKE